MNSKSIVKIVFLVLLLLAITFLACCVKINIPPEMAFKNFSKHIEKENLDDISLTIYYMGPFICTFAPLSVDELVNHFLVQKYVVNSNSLKEHIDVLRQINNEALRPVEHKSYINARIYYVFKTKENHKIFDVAMWGSGNSIFVNGLEVEADDAFYDIVIQFLSEYEFEVKDFEAFIGRGTLEHWGRDRTGDDSLLQNLEKGRTTN